MPPHNQFTECPKRSGQPSMLDNGHDVDAELFVSQPLEIFAGRADPAQTNLDYVLQMITFGGVVRENQGSETCLRQPWRFICWRAEDASTSASLLSLFSAAFAKSRTKLWETCSQAAASSASQRVAGGPARSQIPAIGGRRSRERSDRSTALESSPCLSALKPFQQST
jgi:hypothetical protein